MEALNNSLMDRAFDDRHHSVVNAGCLALFAMIMTINLSEFTLYLQHQHATNWCSGVSDWGDGVVRQG